MLGRKQPLSKGVSKYWAPEEEEKYKRLLASSDTFAERHLIMTIRDLLKYDGRTKEAKKAVAQGRLRLVTATDEELEDLVRLESLMPGNDKGSAEERLQNYKTLRAKINEKGINYKGRYMTP
jgi:hypothetical protein